MLLANSFSDILRRIGAGAGIVLVSATGLASFPAAAQSLPQGERFGDWRVYCNERTVDCRAVNTGRSDDGRSLAIRLERSAQPDGALFVAVAPGLTLKKGMSIEFHVGEDFVGLGGVDEVHGGNEVRFGGQADRALITQMRQVSDGMVRVQFGGTTGAVDYKVVFDGAEAALETIDRAQGRAGRLDAAVLKGPKSPFAVAEPQPVLRTQLQERRSSFTYLWSKRPAQ